MAVHGAITGCDLGDLTALCMPWESIGGLYQPRLTQDAAKLSLELAVTAYYLDVDRWRKAGWRDISYQIDNTLLSGAAVNGNSARGFSSAISDYFQRLAQSRLKRKNPVSQLRGALRQREGSDTCKAVVMIHPAAGGRFVVAIGFMGTGKRIYDWFSNFRLTTEDGMHRGFLQLTRQFEGNLDKIFFPETAKELGLPQLTLADIFEECRRPSSRFFLWMAGHSQGGAVMQLTAYRAVRRGVLRRNMLGYGFASPTVLYDHPAFDPCAFPLFHFINADDVTPRVGARLHVGRCLICQPDDEMRRVCYQKSWDERAFYPMLQLLHTIYDSASAFLSMLGFLRALEQQPEEEAASVLAGFLSKFLPDALLTSLTGRKDMILRPMIQSTEKGYFMASGRETVPREALLLIQRRCAQLMALYGAAACVRALGAALGLPHRIRGLSEGTPAYSYMVTHRFSHLRQQLWMGEAITCEGAPRRRERILPGGRFARLSEEKNRRAARKLHKEAP